eukprot:EG_transcript_28358
MSILGEYLPKVSIIIPVHNAEAWLDDALSSVCFQSYKGLMEVSIYIDGSTDSSENIIANWRSKLLSHAVEVIIDKGVTARGCGFAKNQAVHQSTGDYLCFLDADDMMHPDRIQMQLQSAQQNPMRIVGANQAFKCISVCLWCFVPETVPCLKNCQRSIILQ